MTDKIMRATHIKDKKNSRVVYEELTEQELADLEPLIQEATQTQTKFGSSQSGSQ